jgi:hypothetical protein
MVFLCASVMAVYFFNQIQTFSGSDLRSSSISGMLVLFRLTPG